MKKPSKDYIDREFSPAKSMEERENQMISLAVDRAERQLRDGTASSQVICHYLKLGSTKERLEREIMEEHKELLQAKTEMMNSAKRVEELYSRALDAMRAYSGKPNREEDEDDDYY